MIVQVYAAFYTILFYKHFKKTRFKDFEGVNPNEMRRFLRMWALSKEFPIKH